MKYHPLENFLAKLALIIASDPDFLITVQAAGIDPTGVLGDFLGAYNRVRDEGGSHDTAIRQVGDELRFAQLTADNEPLSAIPHDPDSLRARYRNLKRQSEAVAICRRVTNNPQCAEEEFQGFLLEEPRLNNMALSKEEIPVAFDLVQVERQSKGPWILLRGFEKTSQLIGGFNPKRLTLLLADSGFGKTNLAMNLAVAAQHTMSVIYFNLEMGDEDIVTRYYAAQTEKPWGDILRGEIRSRDIALPKFDISLTRGEELTLAEIRNFIQIKKCKDEHLGLVFVDYDQKILLDYDSSTPEWMGVQRAIKALEDFAKKLEIHVVVMAQVNREGTISSSHRSQFPAHSILKFEMRDGRPIVHNSIKSRHAKKGQGVWLNYDTKQANITEAFDEIENLGGRPKPLSSSPAKNYNPTEFVRPYKED